MLEKVLRRDLCIRFISGKDNLADVFTKPLSAHSFLHQRRKLLFDSSPSSPNHLRGDVEDDGGSKSKNSEKGSNSETRLKEEGDLGVTIGFFECG